MKKLPPKWLFLAVLLSACGQSGPLYLPGDKPPIYVEPSAEPAVKDEDEDKPADSAKPEENKPPEKLQ